MKKSKKNSLKIFRIFKFNPAVPYIRLERIKPPKCNKRIMSFLFHDIQSKQTNYKESKKFSRKIGLKQSKQFIMDFIKQFFVLLYFRETQNSTLHRIVGLDLKTQNRETILKNFLFRFLFIIDLHDKKRNRKINKKIIMNVLCRLWPMQRFESILYGLTT